MDSECKRVTNTKETDLIQNKMKKTAFVDPLTLVINLTEEYYYLCAPRIPRSERQHFQ